jgi:hypothetical protein
MNLETLPVSVQLNIFKGMKLSELMNLRLSSREMRDVIDIYFTTAPGSKLLKASKDRYEVLMQIKDKIMTAKQLNDAQKQQSLILCQTLNLETFTDILKHISKADVVSVMCAPAVCIIGLESTTGPKADNHVEIVIKQLKSGDITKKISYYQGDRLREDGPAVVKMVNNNIV